MTLEMQEVLEREMEDAKAIEDPSRRMEAMITVIGHQMRAVVDCQRKTSERVKAMAEEAARKDSERRGAVFTARCLWAILGALGGLIVGGVTIWAKLKGA